MTEAAAGPRLRLHEAPYKLSTSTEEICFGNTSSSLILSPLSLWITVVPQEGRNISDDQGLLYLSYLLLEFHQGLCR